MAAVTAGVPVLDIIRDRFSAVWAHASGVGGFDGVLFFRHTVPFLSGEIIS